ncbi:MAG: hypothetical protein ACOZQL_04465 [Myxococcota bacterium]
MRRALFFALVGLTGCDYGFRPETLVDDLRLIGISADPPDLRPGETARISSLVLDPSRAPRPSTVLWLGCAADPYNQNRSPCADSAVLADSSSLTGGTGQLPPGVSLIGFNDQVSYPVPAGLFDVLPPDDARRQTGTVGIVLGFAVAETVSPTAPPEELQALFERVQRKEVKSILALFRINISESTARNTNPVVDALVAGGERWPAGAKLLVREREPVTLDLAAPDAAFETWDARTPTGVEPRTERILAAWYSTSGRFSETSTALREDVRTIFTAPGTEKDPVPEKRTGTLYTVLRDTRGGQAWREWGYFVCEDGASAPEVSSIDWPTAAGGEVVLRGAQLQSIVDLVVDGVAVKNGAWSPATGTWSGTLPAELPVGTARGTLHTRACARVPLR